jgi:glucans biosynthesis protein C
MENKRLYYIDWLRVMVILSLIPFHAALTFNGNGDVYLKAPLHDIRILPLLSITSTLGSFFMTLLFFLSGIASYYSFQKRSKDAYRKERTRKVLYPLILGTLLICPVQAYFKGLYEGFSGNLFSFLPEFFSKIFYYMGYGHLWFLLYLYIFSSITVPLFARWLDKKERLSKLSAFICKGKNIYLPILFIIFAEMLLRPFFNSGQTFFMDWANDVVYFSIFIFGFIFGSDEKIQERLERFAGAAIAILILLSILYVTSDYIRLTGTNIGYWGLLWPLTKGFYECSAIIMLVWLGKKYLNKKSTVLSYLSKASFTYYVYHFLPVSMFTYYILKTDMNVFVKYLSIVLLSYLFVFIVYEIFVKRLFFTIKGYFNKQVSL